MATVNITKDNFESEVTLSDKPVLIDFWAAWCGPCRMVSPVIEQIAGERSDIKVGKANIDEQPELAERFGIMSIPTFIIFKNGKAVGKSVGVQPKAAIVNIINNAIK